MNLCPTGGLKSSSGNISAPAASITQGAAMFQYSRRLSVIWRTASRALPTSTSAKITTTKLGRISRSSNVVTPISATAPAASLGP